ncbi:hypothetical protein ILYODFUR_033246 [Ilyodon furcidens]|uniref:Uncharacterized protein n=1 Tax=Ilyodon furcidens TaxID=33524 RepID=A0ABV0TQK8_9TELE
MDMYVKTKSRKNICIFYLPSLLPSFFLVSFLPSFCHSLLPFICSSIPSYPPILPFLHAVNGFSRFHNLTCGNICQYFQVVISSRCFHTKTLERCVLCQGVVPGADHIPDHETDQRTLSWHCHNCWSRHALSGP